MSKHFTLTLSILCFGLMAFGQSVGSSPEYIKALTSEWKGERYPDGRPKVSDNILDRLKNVSMEEAWAGLRNKGYMNQFEGDWSILDSERAMTGRVITAQYMPLRPDLQNYVKEQGIKEKRAQQGGTNSWPIDMLQEGDVYVADGYGKIADGTLIGDNLGNSIYAKSKRGVIFYGSVRDMEGLSKIDGFNAWVKGNDPSYINQMMLTSINTPIRIGRAIVMPGDIVLAKKWGVVFIPAHLVEELLINAEVTALRDQFGIQRLKEGIYKPGEIDSEWTEGIKKDFIAWLGKYPGKLPMSKTELDNYFKVRNW